VGSRQVLTSRQRFPCSTIPTGSARDIEFVADAEGDWGLHCHKVHHLMNGMGHNLPVTLGVKTDDLDARIRKYFPDYMPLRFPEFAQRVLRGPRVGAGGRLDDGVSEAGGGGIQVRRELRCEACSGVRRKGGGRRIDEAV